MTDPRPTPDSPLVARVIASPNHGERKPVPVDILLLHYTGMATTDAALERLCDPAAEVSSHYLVREDGTILQLVPEARRAHHAGKSFWQGETDVNSRSIGIEIGNGGHDFGLPAYPPGQIAAVIALCRDIMERRGIVPERVLAHSDVSPDRKRDPGELFPWHELAAAGVGVWVEPQPPGEGGLGEGAQGEPVRALQFALAGYGYPVEPTGVYDAATTDVVAAFQRHFRPARVDGIADASTLDVLARLTSAQI